MKNEKIDNSYIVKLVTPAHEVKKQKETAEMTSVIKKKPPVPVKPEKKPQPVKKQQKVTPAETTIKSIKQNRSKKQYASGKELSKSLPPIADSRRIESRSRGIKRKASQPKGSSDRSFSMNRAERESSLNARPDTDAGIRTISGKGVTGKNEYLAVEKGFREQAFHAERKQSDDQSGIYRKERAIEEDIVQQEEDYRGSMYEGKGADDPLRDSEHAIVRSQGEEIQNAELDNYHDNAVQYPGTDFNTNSGPLDTADTTGLASIERPDDYINAQDRKEENYSAENKFINQTLHADNNFMTNNDSAGELLIKGVPLDDLNACDNALDERMLKKKILNVIGESKQCYSKDLGGYLFTGTSRFVSFDMKILSLNDRKLSNRCEELENALYCLTSERKYK